MAKIVVIEDNPTILEEVLVWLELEEYEAVGAANGRAGIELVLRQMPDLVISDIMMPEKDGYRVLLELRAQPLTALIPFIFLTAKQEKIDVRHGMELGADDYITKPFSREEFLGAVQARLARSKRYLQHHNKFTSDIRHYLLRVLPHELRTPLVGILGIGELLSQDAQSLTPAELKEYATLIITSGRRLHRLIENHLLYTQLEMDVDDAKQAQQFSSQDVTAVDPLLSQISADVAATYHRLADLQLDVQPGVLPMWVNYWVKVVHELVDNAFKFSKTPTPVTVTGSIQANHYVLTITDRGRGLTSENITRIDAYVQFERATYEQQGAGLGLAIVRQLVGLHGGTFQIESTPGVGTTVCVTLMKA